MRTRLTFLHLVLGFVLATVAASSAEAFHFPWDQGHDTFQPNPPNDAPKPECPEEDNRCKTSAPVDIGAGDKVQDYVDFDIPGFGPALRLERSYHSQDLSDGPFGIGWHSNLTTHLILVTDGKNVTAIVSQGNGKRKRFPKQQDGSFSMAPGTWQRLIVHPDGSAELRDKDGSIQFFNRVGRLTSVQDRNGNALTIGYDADGVIASATGPGGRAFTFTVGADGRIANVSDPMGRSFEYEYDSNGYMSKAVDPEGGETLYDYHADGNLHTVVDARGNTVVTLTYDNQDRVIREVLADGATFQFQYISDTQTRVTNPRHYQTLFTFNETGQPLEIEDPLNRRTQWTWDKNYNRLTETDGNGYTTTYTYDANGNLLTEIDALNQITTYTYEPRFNQVASKTDAEGNVTRFEYDARGNLITIIDAVDNQATLTYNAQGQLNSATDPRGNTTRFGFDAFGNLTSVTDPLNETATMTHDAVGNLTSMTDTEGRTVTFEYDGLNRRTKVTDAAGGETLFTYDANGNKTSVTDPRGNTATYSYDSRNRLTETTNALSQHESRGYDLNGNLTSVTDVARNTTTYGYDAADQLETETPAGSASFQYVYDNAGNRTTVIDPTGVRIEQTYDALGRLTGLVGANGDMESYSYDRLGNHTRTQRKDAADQISYTETRTYDALSRAVQIVAGMGQTTELEYDANGNLITISDPMGRTIGSVYDALDRIIQLTDAANSINEYSYDGAGNLTSITGPNGLVAEYSYDALDRQELFHSPDNGTTTADYDANGNLAYQVDSRGVAVTHTYDALNRRTATSFPAVGEDRTYLYDEGRNGTGRLTGYDDESGSTRFNYDSRGNILTKRCVIQGKSYSLRYAYDAADRLTTLTYPSGLVVAYSHDDQGRVRSITADGQPVLTSAVYLPFGPATTWTDGSSFAHTESFDSDYRPTGISVDGIQDFGYLYDLADNITDWTDGLNAGNTQAFDYDDLDRLIKANGPYGAIDFTYDAVGNRLSKTLGTDEIKYTYDNSNNRLQETTGADSEIYSYDAAGNLVQDDRFHYLYNQANRLSEVKEAGAATATYVYNAEGQRVAKTVGSKTRHFVYGPESMLLGVYDGITGAALEELIYFGSDPVATIRNGSVYYIHNDHLGTPRLVSDKNHTVVWRWISTPYGETRPDQDPDGDGTAFVINLRLPGQYFDEESDLHFNFFRDYTPKHGRYIQSDPLSPNLVRASAPYSYANNNPIAVTDRRGLDSDSTAGLDNNRSDGGPGFVDQFNWKNRDSAPYRDYSEYFDRRFPNTIRGARKEFAMRIHAKACSSVGETILPALSGGAGDIDIQPDMRRFGDNAQNWWERNVRIGAFELKTETITLTWNVLDCGSDCYTFQTTMYVLENTGENLLGWPFRERAVRMADWPLSGGDCCKD